jgi:hypothetical protein
MPIIGHELYGPTIPYVILDNDTQAATIALDGTNSGLLKIGVSATSITNPTTISQITIDPSTNGNITLNPNGTGTVNIDYGTQYVLPIFGATGAVQNLADGLGNAGKFLMSNGVGFEPTWEDAASANLTITEIDDTDSPYTVLSTDQFMSCDVSNDPITLLLPNSTTTGRVIYIKDSLGNAGSENISVTTVGGVVEIDGETTYVINTDYQSINLVFDGNRYLVF